ncbi:MAG: LTA synthase family protein [Muribaculaceae bacterium]
MKNNISGITNWRLRFALATYMCMILSLFYLEMVTYEGTPSFLFRIIAAIADATLIILPFTFLKHRGNVVLAIVPAVLSLLVLANVLYYRCFCDLIPASSYFGSSLTDSFVIDGALAALKLGDALLLVTGLLPLVLWCFIRNIIFSEASIKRLRYTILSIFCIAWLCTFVGSYRRESIYASSLRFADVAQHIYPKFSVDWKKYYNNTNFSGYVVRCVQRAMHCDSPLSESERDEIRSFLAARAAGFQRHAATDTPPHNLIMIVVESLQSNVLTANRGKMPTATLDSLIADSTTVYVEKCKVWADKGRSSDAQFIYNTGLLPLSSEPLVTNYASNDYPSIAKALRYESVEIIGENKSLWSHGITSQSYGFDRLIDGIAERGLNQDSIIFSRALAEIETTPAPLYAFITTITMHDPYESRAVEHVLKLNGNDYNATTVEYLERLNHFDKSLRSFLSALKDKGIYDNSIIVIAGDHEVRSEANVNYPADCNVPLIILNAPSGAYRTTDVSQLDVFPTIIDMMNMEYDYMQVPYVGLGVSIFMPYTPIDYDASRKISEWIITRQ